MVATINRSRWQVGAFIGDGNVALVEDDGVAVEGERPTGEDGRHRFTIGS